MSLKRLTILLCVIIGALAQAACGADQPASKAAAGSPENPLVATRPGESTSANGAAVPNGEPATAPAPTTNPGYKALLDRQTAHPQQRFTPCNLVTRREAEVIVGKPMREPFEAPQGPTCIYRPRAGDSLVALSVQETEFGTIRDQVNDLRRVDVRGRKAYCGTYGQPMLYLPLSGGRLLSVNGRCEIARAFAVRALPHL